MLKIVDMVVNLASVSNLPKLGGENESARTLRQVFENIDADSCPQSFNFHMHTIFSDGRLKPEELMSQAIAIGLQGLAITDHHSIDGYQVARCWLEDWKATHSQQAAPQLWTGLEVNANLLKTEVHILGYAFDPQHPRLLRYLQGQAPTGSDYEAANVIAAIHQAGGLAVLAHPSRYPRSAAQLIPEAARWGIDGVETYYAYNNPQPWQPSPKQTKQVRQLGEIYGLLHTCGTDTHGKNLLMRL